MAAKKVLVPFNFTPYDERALHYVIKTYAGQKNTEVTLFHVYTPPPPIDKSSPRLGSLRTTLAGMYTDIREKERDLKSIKADIVENGFLDEQIKIAFRPKQKAVAAEIVDEAREGGYNTVVMARQPRKATRLFTTNVHDSLISELKDMEIVIIV